MRELLENSIHGHHDIMMSPKLNAGTREMQPLEDLYCFNEKKKQNSFSPDRRNKIRKDTFDNNKSDIIPGSQQERGFPGGSMEKESTCQSKSCRRHGFGL